MTKVQQRRQALQALRKARLAQGLCRCSKKPRPGRTTCERCYQAARRWLAGLSKERNAARKRRQHELQNYYAAQGRCRCGRKRLPGKRRCASCHHSDALSRQKRRASLTVPPTLS